RITFTALNGSDGSRSPQGVRPERDRNSLGRVLGEGKPLRRRHLIFRTSRVYAAFATSECDWTPAYGAHAEPDGDGYHRALAPYARVRHVVAPGHGSRRYRHADDGRAPVGQRGKIAPRA